jgi:hypothetical protein
VDAVAAQLRVDATATNRRPDLLGALSPLPGRRRTGSVLTALQWRLGRESVAESGAAVRAEAVGQGCPTSVVTDCAARDALNYPAVTVMSVPPANLERAARRPKTHASTAGRKFVPGSADSWK